MMFQLPISVQHTAFGPGWGNYAIKGIVEAELPSSVAMWPQTVGWLVLAIALIVFLLAKLLKSLLRYWRNRYRRLALAALDALQQRVLSGDMTAARELPVLIKSTALQCYNREHIAQLAGDDWGAFLSASYSGPAFELGENNMLQFCAYAPLPQLADQLTERHWQQFAQWIKTHRALV